MKLFNGLILGLSFLAFHSPALAETELATPQQPLEITITTDSVTAERNQYYYYNFGNVRVNWSEWADFYLRNNGHSPLYVAGVYVYGSAFRGWSNCPRYLYPGQSCLTRVEFRPWYEGYQTGRLRFDFSGGNIYVDLSGYGVRW